MEEGEARGGRGVDKQEPHATPFIVMPAGRTLKECWLRQRRSSDYFAAFRPLQARTSHSDFNESIFSTDQKNAYD